MVPSIYSKTGPGYLETRTEKRRPAFVMHYLFALALA
jgi:hypothetical protein